MPTPIPAKALSCTVWNAGDDSSDDNGCATSECVEIYGLAAMMTATGGPVLDEANSTVDENGGNVRLTSVASADWFSDVKVGMVAWIEFSAIYESGYYEIIDVETGSPADEITLDLTYVDPAPAAEPVASTLTIGGAFKDLDTIGNDDLTDATSYDKTIYVVGNEDVAAAVDITNGGTGANKLYIIWVDADNDFAEWPLGEYGVFSSTGGASLGGAALLTLSGNQIVSRAGHCYNNGGGGGGSVANDFGLLISGDRNVIINCKASACKHGFSTTGADTLFINPVSMTNNGQGIGGGGDKVIIGGYIADNVVVGITSGAGSLTVIGTIITNTPKGIQGIAAAACTVLNCGIYKITNAGVFLNNASANALIMNNIIDVSDVRNIGDYAIQQTAGVYTEFKNITNAHADRSGFQSGSGSVDGLAFTGTDPWTDPANGNYSINIGQTIADTYVINQGLVSYLGPDTGDNYISLGPWQPEHIEQPPASPTAPTLTITVSGTTATATIDGDSGVTNYLIYKIPSEADWTAAGNRSGDGDIVVAGLSKGVRYTFVAYSTNDRGPSTPSIAVDVLIQTSTTSVLDAGLAGDADMFLATFGEPVIYYPRGGGSRDIVAVVDRNPVGGVSGLPHGSTPRMEVVVKNNSDDGISSSEVNTGGDKIGLDVRFGTTDQARMIKAISWQDAGMMHLEVAS